MITVLNERAIAVEVNKDSYDFHFEKSELYGTWVLAYKSPVIWQKYGREMWNWKVQFDYAPEILGKGNDLTREQWIEIIEGWHFGTGRFMKVANNQFKDYLGKSQFFETATESGLSLLKSKNIDPSKVIILIKQQ